MPLNLFNFLLGLVLFVGWELFFVVIFTTGFKSHVLIGGEIKKEGVILNKETPTSGLQIGEIFKIQIYFSSPQFDE